MNTADSPRGTLAALAAALAALLALLVLTSAPAWSAAPNETPTLAGISDVTILEDSGVQGVPLSGISYGADGTAQTLTITAVSGNVAVLLNPTVVYTSANATGTLLLAPISDQFGTAIVTVMVRDNGGTAGGSIDTVVRTFTVTVLPVNDQPLMAVIADCTINEDGPQQNVALSGITAGPANESAQNISISAVSSDPTLIPHPTISYTSPATSGTLSFTPVPHRSGTATILVTVGDDGGTSNAGFATTYVSFTVTVDPIPHVPAVVTNTGLLLPIGTSKVIARANLEVDDYGPAVQLTYRVVALPTAGELRLRGVTQVANGTFTQADLNAGLVVYRHTGLLAVTDGFTFTVTNAELNSLPTTAFAITVSGVAGTTTPVVTLPSGPSTWVQGGGAVLLDSGATVSDASGTLVGGTLTVSLVANSGAGDVLSVRNVGTGAGQIGVSGSVVTYAGSTIGTVTGGSGSPLSVALAGTATPTGVQALVRNLRFTNGDAAPAAATRTIQVVLVNGTGGASAPVTTDVQVQPVNQPPVVALPRVTVAYLEASGALVLDDSATVVDADSATLGGGQVVATWTANATVDDVLAIRHQGTGTGQIAVSGNSVSWNNNQIATISGGGAGTPLILNLTAAATPAAVQAALRNLTFDNQSPTPSLALRQLAVTVSDGEGGTSSAAALTVVVQSSDNPPVVTLPSPAPTWLEGSGEQVIDALAGVTDVDSTAFATGLLVAEFTGGATADDYLTILSQGSGAGQIDVVGVDARYGGVIIGQITGPGTIGSALVVRLDGDATVAATQALLRRLAFSNDATSPIEGLRMVRVYLTDGSGGTSLPVTTTVTVQAVNVAPGVTLPSVAPAWTEHATPSLIDAAATVSDGDSASLSGGALVVSLSDAVAGDRLTIRATGVGAGQVSQNGSSVLVSGIAVGTLAGGADTTPLTVTFSAFATPAAAQAILRAVQFSHDGQFIGIETRAVSVTVSDGIATSVAATTTITLTPVDDLPTTSAITLVTVVEVPVRATLPGVDPENGALTWEIVTAPASGTLTLTNAATGAVTYTPALGQVADASFTFRVRDGRLTTWSAPALATVRLTALLDSVRPLIISSPLREGVIGATYTYLITVDTTALPPGSDLRYQVVGAPVGATVTVTRTTATTATLTWDQTGAAGLHRQVGVVVSDTITGTAGYQAVQIHWLAVAPGGAG